MAARKATKRKPKAAPSSVPEAIEPVPGDALERALSAWFSAVAAGENERVAAVDLERAYSVTYADMVERCEGDPAWGAALEVARAGKRAALERVLFESAIKPNLTEEPASLNVRCSNAKWLLARWYPEVYGDRQRIEASGPKGGPIPMAATTVSIVYEPGSEPPDGWIKAATDEVTRHLGGATMRFPVSRLRHDGQGAKATRIVGDGGRATVYLRPANPIVDGGGGDGKG